MVKCSFSTDVTLLHMKLCCYSLGFAREQVYLYLANTFVSSSARQTFTASASAQCNPCTLIVHCTQGDIYAIVFAPQTAKHCQIKYLSFVNLSIMLINCLLVLIFTTTANSSQLIGSHTNLLVNPLRMGMLQRRMKDCRALHFRIDNRHKGIRISVYLLGFSFSVLS